MIEELYKIEFIDGEEVCRLDSILLTDEYFNELCGIDTQIDYYSKNVILICDILYTNSKTIGEILLALGEYYEPIEKYDMISSKGYGMQSHYARERLNDSIVISNFTDIKDIEIKSINDFHLEYPDFNYEEYTKIMNSLDYYYKHMNDGNT